MSDKLYHIIQDYYARKPVLLANFGVRQYIFQTAFYYLKLAKTINWYPHKYKCEILQSKSNGLDNIDRKTISSILLSPFHHCKAFTQDRLTKPQSAPKHKPYLQKRTILLHISQHTKAFLSLQKNWLIVNPD